MKNIVRYQSLSSTSGQFTTAERMNRTYYFSDDVLLNDFNEIVARKFGRGRECKLG